jgi:S1-C subfamily serine protease
MQRLICLLLVLIGALCAERPAIGRSMDLGEASILRQVAPAVVSISVWKARASDQSREPSRRVKTYGSGFIVDSLRNHRYQPARY